VSFGQGSDNDNVGLRQDLPPLIHPEQGVTVAYTGTVTVGGPADVREVPGLRITKVATPPFNNNC
jgi:hypothetical protein